MLILKRNLILLCVFSFSFVSLTNAKPKNSKFARFGIQGSLDVFIHPDNKDAFEKANGKDWEKNSVFIFPGAGIFLDFKTVDSISIGLNVYGVNRGFSKSNKDNGESVVTQFYCIDAALPFAYMPGGFDSGVSFYLGPKIFYKIFSKTVRASVSIPPPNATKAQLDKLKEDKDKKEKDAKEEDIGKEYVDFNIAVTAGFKCEIDYTGFFFGADFDFFFLNMKKETEVLKGLKESVSTLEQKITDDATKAKYTPGIEAINKEIKEESEKLKSHSMGARFYIGYDFLRLVP